MFFNWDNQHLHTMVSPPFACGQWLINSLSYSQNLCPCAPTETIEYLLLGGNRDRQGKHQRMLQHLPKMTHQSWHYDTGFYDSIRWLYTHEGFGKTMEDDEEPGELLFQGVTADMKLYIEKFWRNHAIRVSKSDMGFMMKFHYSQEGRGYANLVPHTKFFTIENYEYWQHLFVKKSKIAPDIVKHWKTKAYDKVGFIFDLDVMIRDQDAFVKQMKEAYDYAGFEDFKEVKENLIEYRKMYILANTRYTK